MDGSIAFEADRQLTISCKESITLTHGLRTIHDAILIGIGTVLSDDPQLTARYYEGSNPRPVIVDSQLRTPVDAQLLVNPPVQPIIATTEAASEERIRELKDAGAKILVVPARDDGRADLNSLLAELIALDISTLMVEGGARIITGFLAEQLADSLILTIAPHLLGGLRGVRNLNLPTPVDRPHLADLHHRQVGRDLIVWGKLNWGEE